MNHLHRSLAPISDAGWAEIDEEAVRSLGHFLAARKLVDVEGPLGLDLASISIGRVDEVKNPSDGDVTTAVRSAQPLLEIRRSFTLARAELDAIDRGARDADLDPVVDAARAFANAEDTAVFRGFADGHITGMHDASPHSIIKLSEDFDRYPNHVAKAIAVLKEAGVGGPYALALGPKCYAGVIESTDKGGYPLLNHLSLILGGPVVWAPAVDGAVVMSERRGDFQLTLGEDAAVGYLSHDADTVTLELRESMTFQALSPEAAVVLQY
ncbi:MAG TPA: family 1 encapsulin nanocompartment shell protein [Acidimicrobiales bacterium]|nr:family 1 encapsulin nanocompartment shell protein [Acidimicrobiales bacterium]